MKSEKLQCLLYSFLENRQECDAVDGPVAECYIAAEFDDPQPRPRFQDQFPAQGGGLFPPASPIHLFPFGSITPSPAAAVTGRRLSELAEIFSLSEPEKSIIKFKDVCIVKEPKEQIVSIPVNRIQSFIDQETKVSYETCDKTALAGTHYVGTSGELLFNKGDTEKAIDIQILNCSGDVNDLRFTVKLHHVGGLFDPSPLTVALEKIDVLYSNEIQVLNNLLGSRPMCVSDIRSTLEDCLNSRTFHMALTHLCSYGSTTDHQLALAFELSRLCVRKLPGFWSKTLSGESILNILTDFFRMDEIDF